MYDHRLAQVRHQETINKACGKRRQKTADPNGESMGIRKLVVMVTSMMSLLAMKN